MKSAADPLEACVRVLTLVPIGIAVKAIAGETDRSVALIEALGYDRPAAWDENEGSVRRRRRRRAMHGRTNRMMTPPPTTRAAATTLRARSALHRPRSSSTTVIVRSLVT